MTRSQATGGQVENRRSVAFAAFALATLSLLSGCTAPSEDLTPELIAFRGTPCADLQLNADPPEFRLGETTTLNLTILNCGHPPIPIRPSGMCFRDQGLGVHIPYENTTYYLYDGLVWNNIEATNHTTEPPMDPAFWGVSQGACMLYQDKPPTRIELGEGITHTDRLVWNGTLHRAARCSTSSDDNSTYGGYTYCPEPIQIAPGTYTLYSNFTWTALGAQHNVSATANVTVLTEAEEGTT